MARTKSWEQYKEECEIIALTKGYKILGYKEWKGCETKLLIECPTHGVWDTCKISNFKNGRSCPSCGLLVRGEKKTKSREDQEKECEKEALKRGWRFLGIYGEWLKAKKTRVILRCDKGHEFNTSTIDNFKNNKQGCPECRLRSIGKKNSLEDNKHIADFMATGAFLEGTVFWKSKKKKRGTNAYYYWFVTCPVCSNDKFVKAGLCSGIFESHVSCLKTGNRPCRCSSKYKYTKEQWEYRIKEELSKSGHIFQKWDRGFGAHSKFIYLCLKHGKQTVTPSNCINNKRGCPGCAGSSQQEFYINAIFDEYGQDTGYMKLGIAKDSDVRIKRQNSKNNYTMQRVALFDLPSYQDCRALESLLKSKEVVPSIGSVERLHMKDGHSETFLREDLAIVLSAINQAGGIMRQEEIC